MTTSAAPLTARARVRAQLTQEIKDAARRQLTEVGGAALSLRAVARELNMASSAVYRYFPSRDDLLTALIVDAYEAAGAAAEQAEAAVRRGDLLGRYMATVRAVRAWAVSHPQEYSLIFGTPVPGYRAPQDTIDPAARIPLLLLAILAAADPVTSPAAKATPLARTLRSDLRKLASDVGLELEPLQLAGGLKAWTLLIGLISFELFGHLNNVIHDYAAHFDFQHRSLAGELGLGAR